MKTRIIKVTAVAFIKVSDEYGAAILAEDSDASRLLTEAIEYDGVCVAIKVEEVTEEEPDNTIDLA